MRAFAVPKFLLLLLTACLLLALCPAQALADATPVPKSTLAQVTPADGSADKADKPSVRPSNDDETAVRPSNDDETAADDADDATDDDTYNEDNARDPWDEPDESTGVGIPALPPTLAVFLYDSAAGDSRRTDVVPVNLAFDGALLPSDVPGMAVSGRTLVPVRLISEQLQAEVVWEKTNNTVTIALNGKTIILTIGSNTALIDNEIVAVPDNVSVALVTYEGVSRTMVPVRFVSEALDALVDYDSAQRLVNITPPQIEPEPDEDDEPVYVKPVGIDEDGNLYRRVIIDAGHGGSDPGTNGGGIEEKELTLTVAQLVRDLLEDDDFEVIMSREDDEFVELLDRAALAAQYDAPVFVSIHCNAAENVPTANGIETYAAPDDPGDLELAGYLQERLIDATAANNRGVKTSRLVVLTHNVVPAALVEIGFMTNAAEVAKMSDEDYQQTLAEAICAGIEDYFDAH